MADITEITTCGECGMWVLPNEYHPYAACVMYKHTHQSEKVASWLQDVENHGAEKAAAALRAENARLRDVLAQTATAHHSYRRHNQSFETCGYVVCKKARAALAQPANGGE